MESGPQYIYLLQSFVFSRENYMVSTVSYVLSCYIPCIAHTFVHSTVIAQIPIDI